MVSELPPGKGYAVVCDLSKVDQCAHLVQEAVRLMGGLDVVVNNGGPGDFSGDPMGADQYHHHFDMHVVSALGIIKEALPHLLASRGCVVTVSSICGGQVRPTLTPHKPKALNPKPYNTETQSPEP